MKNKLKTPKTYDKAKTVKVHQIIIIMKEMNRYSKIYVTRIKRIKIEALLKLTIENEQLRKINRNNLKVRSRNNLVRSGLKLNTNYPASIK